MNAIDILALMMIGLPQAPPVRECPPQAPPVRGFAETIPARVPPALQAVVKQSLTTQTLWTTRPPIGHTHTDRNGHTWDHAENPSHVCKICGAVQYAVDRTPRPVTIARVVTEPQRPIPDAPRAAPAAFQAPPVLSAVGLPRATSGGCANGQCAYPTVIGWRR